MSRSLEVSRGTTRHESTASSRPLILVIDPDQSSRSVLEVALARDGFDVWSSATSDGALELLLQGRSPDVVVLESDLGGEDGVSVVAQLRGNTKTAKVPVLLLARADDESVDALAEVVGVDDVIHKPAFARDISALVRLELAVRSGAEEMTLNAATLPAAHLLRALLSCPKSGRLELADGRAEVRFRNGRVIDVDFDGRTDLDALVRALALTAGTYRLTFEAITGRPELTCTVRELVQQVLPRLARWAKVQARSLPLDARLAVDFSRLAVSLKAMPDEVNRVVQLFDGFRTMQGVLLDSPFSETLTLEVATRLYLMGVIVPATGETQELIVPKAMPKLFEPRAAEVEELMKELFAGNEELRAEVSTMSTGLGDWFEEPRGTGLDVADPAGGWTTAPAPEALAKDLAPELLKQLDAFNIPVVVEKPEVKPEVKAVSAFAHGVPSPSVTLEHAVQTATGDEQAKLVAKSAEKKPAVEVKPAVEATPELDDVLIPASSDEPLVLAPVAGDRQQRIVTPVLTPVVVPAGAEAQNRIVTPVLVKATPTPTAESVEASFFESAATEAAETELPAPKQRARWPWVALVLGVLGVAVLIESLRETPVEAQPVVAPAAEAPAPAPVPAVDLAAVTPDIEEPTFIEEEAPPAIDVSENLVEAKKLYEAGQYKQAISVLEQVVTDDPKSVAAWNLLGLVRYDAMDSKGAREATEKVLALEPNNARVQLLIATMHFDANEKAEGKAALQRYLELDPNGANADEARELLKR